jgi:16S rRNA (guanine527-N7)-methyltransferase
MDHDMQLLADGCAQMGLGLSEMQISQFDRYLSLLLEWNEKFNLTAITDPREVIIQHFLDSVSVLKLALIQDGASVLDMGSGAGFPGIPLKIMLPGIRLTMVDAVQKKTVFLQEVIRYLDLNQSEAIHARAEDLGKAERQREAYDLVVSRAVAELRVLLEYCMPFVKTGGFFVSHKGPGAAEEMEQAKKAIQVLGGHAVKTEKMNIPFSEKTHNLVVVKKTSRTPINYPRQAGKPKKSPL